MPPTVAEVHMPSDAGPPPAGSPRILLGPVDSECGLPSTQPAPETSQNRTVPSKDPEATVLPSGEKATHET
jgi:hypothetical protein